MEPIVIRIDGDLNARSLRETSEGLNGSFGINVRYAVT